MTTETVLTEIEMANICQDYAQSEDLAMGRAIEQAVLQSEQVQAWKRDAERLDWLADQEAQIQSMTMHVSGNVVYRIGWPDDGEYRSDWHPTAREAIDAAMEKKE